MWRSRVRRDTIARILLLPIAPVAMGVDNYTVAYHEMLLWILTLTMFECVGGNGGHDPYRTRSSWVPVRDSPWSLLLLL
jgi:hypothetical protein